jgi:molybdate transport system ATP-binding protein
MSLRAHLVVTRARFTLDVRLDIEPGEVVALLGPNGAGKSTALRALAGLEPLAAGSVHLDGAPLDDVAAGVHVPPQQRALGVVFQDYLLFPHLSALDNVAFGLRARGIDKAAARAHALDLLRRMGLADLADVRPRQLSGGQAQRVALARALAVAPRLLLLDEPLAALDAATRVNVRADLRHHLSAYGGCCLLVTHDPLDAMVLADRLIILENGRVTQEGTPVEVARTPRTDYVARLVGLNLYRGVADGTRVRLPGGHEITLAHAGEGEVFVAFPPTAVALYRTRPDGSPRNCWEVGVASVERHGDLVRIRLEGDPALLADVTPSAVAELGLTPGVRVWAAVKATEIRSYPA